MNSAEQGPPFRVGLGSDIHALAAGRPLILCGCRIPFDRGLLGHSDADAPVHALIDACLGALALGDIGGHFPDRDPRWKDADSLTLLRQVLTLPEFASWQLANADVIIDAEAPKLAPWLLPMRRNLAAALACPLERVSVKAKTAEKFGPVGTGAALSAQAVVLWYRA